MILFYDMIWRIREYLQTQKVKQAWLFGSYARQEATEESDIDILVELDYAQGVGMEYVDMYLTLQKITGKKVDLVTTNALSKYIKPFVDQDKILIMKQKPTEKARLQHIHDALIEIQSYLKGYDLDTFRHDSKTKFATVKQLEIVGEAVYHISEPIRNLDSSIEWEKMASLRHILVHEYYGIDAEIVWQIATVHVADLVPKIEKIIAQI